MSMLTSPNYKDGNASGLLAGYLLFMRLPRLVRRDLPFEQSSTTVQVEHNQGWKIYRLVRYDFFHFLLRRPTWKSIGFLLTVWTIVVLLFGGLYYAVDRQDPNVSCGLGRAGHPISFYGAFAFSLETCTTVGYTLPDSNNFFATCPALQVTIYFQMVWSMMFNAFLFSFFFARLARADLRAIQVVFSKQAIVSFDDVTQQVRFQVRVYDVDARHPVVEAHARLYVVRRLAPVPRLLRILQPNDEFNSMLFLSMPSVIHHHIDVHSLLHPATPSPAGGAKTAGVMLRQADSLTHNREEFICPICSENFGSPRALERHVRYQQLVEQIGNYPIHEMHRSITADALQKYLAAATPISDLNRLRTHFEAEIVELICVVEGIHPMTSGTFQALQSYRSEDIVWDAKATFHPCLTVANTKEKGEHFLVDLDRFHRVDRVVPPPASALPQPSSSSTLFSKRPSKPKEQTVPKIASASASVSSTTTASSATTATSSTRVRMRSYRLHDSLFDELDRSRTRLPAGILTAPDQVTIEEEDEHDDDDDDDEAVAAKASRPHRRQHKRSRSDPLSIPIQYRAALFAEADY